MRYLALCCIVKDEGPFLREWLAYHAHVGVEHFFLYDNGSSVPMRESLGEFAASDMVTVLNASGKAMQLTAYNHCLSEFGSRFFWLGFCDIDEFICAHTGDDIRPLLAEYEEYGALALSWRMFGSNGHEKRPQGLVIDAYTRYLAEADPHIKSIVRPAKTTGCRNAHAFGYVRGEVCVNERHDVIPAGSPFWLPSYEKIWLNHYFYKSRHDFAEKLHRGSNSPAQEAGPNWHMGIFDDHLTKETLPDATITRFSPAVGAMLDAGRLSAPWMPQPEDAPLDTALQTIGAAAQDGGLARAEAALCHATARWPDLAELHLMRASLARDRGEFALARRFLRRAAAIGESPELYHEIAQLCRAQGDAAGAADAARLLRWWLKRTPGADPVWAERLKNL